MDEFRPPVVEPTPRRVRVRLGATLVADSSRAFLLDEISSHGFPTYFVPFDDVRDDVLVDSTEGRWSVVAGGRRVEDAAWTDDRFEQLKGHVTFSWQALD